MSNHNFAWCLFKSIAIHPQLWTVPVWLAEALEHITWTIPFLSSSVRASYYGFQVQKNVYHFFIFFKWEWKEKQKIHKPLCLWSPFSTKALFSSWAGFKRLLGLHGLVLSHATGVLSVPFFLSLSLSLTVFLMHQQRYRWFSPHCHSAVSRIWRSILWRRAWEEQTNQRGEMRRKCDWLACGGRGGERNMHTQ